MTEPEPQIDWSATTWEGSRRAQLRQAQKLTIRERLAAAEGLAEVARRFEQIRAQGGFKAREPEEQAGDAATAARSKRR